MATRVAVDPQWWVTDAYDGRSMPEILRTRDVGALFRFLGGRGWSRSAIAAATGLSETRVREAWQGKQLITSYEVLERIADGLNIERGLMGWRTSIKARRRGMEDADRSGLRHFTHPVDGKTMVLVDEGVFRFGAADTLV